MLDNPDTIPTAIALRMSFAGKSGITYIPTTPNIPPAMPTIIGMYIIPNFPANDILNAIAVGIVSGLSSTGVNQIYKQVKKDA